MKIQHRVSLNSTRRIRARLAKLGVAAGSGNALTSHSITFIVDEDHPSWPRIADLIDEWDALDIVTTKFTKEEIDQAAHVELEPTWHHGYPQPEDDFGYRATTYDLSDFCVSCGIGARQNTPFQMKGEPNWGKKTILQLNWVFDEFFVTPELWHAVFEPVGVKHLPVLRKDGEELATVVQLVIPDEVEIDGSELPTERCPTCGREKYLPTTRGFFPALVGNPTSLARTTQYFGSGLSAFRAVIAHQDIARALSERKVQGASLRPVAQKEQ